MTLNRKNWTLRQKTFFQEINIPHYTMLLQSPCLSCGTNLEFEVEQRGQFIACPSCQNQTRLGDNLQTAPAAFAGPQKVQGLTGWIIIFGSLFGISLLVFLLVKYTAIPDALATALGFAGNIVMEIFAGIFAVMSFILGVFWIIFPWMVYTLLRRIHSELVLIRAQNSVKK